MVRIKRGAVLISAVHPRSGGQNGSGVWGGGAARRERKHRGGASSEKSESGLPGVDSSGAWV